MKIIQTTTSDKIVLNGLLFEPANKTETIIINIHGMSGDPYRNSFYPSMIATYPTNNIAFLSAENRGMQNITQFNTSDGGIVNIGNTFETFEDCVFDIEAWVSRATQLGYTKIWLQGHSLGPSKIVYYLNNSKHEAVSGLIFLSPSEMIGLVHDEVGQKDHDILLLEAKELVQIGKPNQILSHPLWGNMLLSAKTYLNFFDDSTKTAIFNYWKPDLGWTLVNNIKLPVLAFTTTNDDGILPVIEPHRGMEMLESQLINSPKLKTVVFKGSDHDFTGFGQQIADTVIEFISSTNEN